MMKTLLRLEGTATFALATAAYFTTGGAGWLFAALLLAPDVAMLGYLAGPRAGAAAYNALHHLAGPLALLALGLLGGGALALHLALIWLAHIGIDRTFGYGMKYATRFTDTHLARV